MHKLIYFIRRTSVAILFVVIEIIAIRSYAYSTPYTQARLLGMSNAVTGSFYALLHNIKGYFSLRSENERLTARVAELENRLDALGSDAATVDISASFHQYEYIPARVVSNSINRQKNYITLNKGISDGVSSDMAVLSPDGCAVGTIIDCSEHYAVAKSLLNTEFRISGVLAKDGSPGAVWWRGGDSQIVEFDGVPKYATVEVGDEVRAAGFSHYFPPEAVIGTVESAEVVGNTYHCRLRLAADMARLQNVVLVNNMMGGEAQNLEASHK